VGGAAERTDLTRTGDDIGFLPEMFTTARDEQVTFPSAAVAYCAFVSIVPLLLLDTVVGTAVGGTELVDAVESLPTQLLDALVVLGTIPLAVVAAIAVAFIVPTLGVIPYANLSSVVTLLLSLTLLLLPACYVFPNVPMSVGHALPGAVFAATGWTVLSETFRVYARFAGRAEVYGFLGAALLLVTWLYVGAIIITLGAVLNAVLSGRTDDHDEPARDPPDEAPDVAELGAEVEALRAELDAKTVSKADLESDLEQYVRRRQRRGKARGWGPYLVLLYGTAMTIGAFVYMSGGWAILAMVVVWLSTLGLYTLMVLFGLGLNAVGIPGRLADSIRSWRS